MKNWFVKSVIIFSSLLFFSILLGFFSALIFQFYTCSFAIERLSEKNPISPVQFFVYGTSPGTVSCRFGLYDKFGREIAMIERSWNGTELYLDFAKAQFGETVLLFPMRLYTDESKGNGIELSHYYKKDGFCQIYSVLGDDEQEKKYFARLCDFAISENKNPLLKKYTGIATVRLTGYQTGKTATIFTAQNGKVLVLQ